MLTRYSISSALTLLLGILLGVMLGYLVLKSDIYWLIISVALLAALIAWWQTPCIQVDLSDETQTPSATEKPQKKQKRFPCFKRWLWRLSAYLLLVIAVALGESWWWVKQPVIMNLSDEYNSETKRWDATQKQTHLPTNYAFKRILWQLGINKPYPELVKIKAGDFEMGSNKGDDDEKPIHKVSLKNSFQISKNEITFNEYDYYIWSVQKELANLSKKKIVNYSFDQDWGRDNRPVINVNWHDAQGYANWLGKQTGQSCRLPSEAEWEYVARAGSQKNYSWGDDIGKNKANCLGCGSQWERKSAPVGSFSPNPFGLNDMHGNVYEWVQDCYKNNYANVPTNGSAYEEAKCDGRVLRGGSWGGTSGLLRSAYRGYYGPDVRNSTFGFRIFCAPPSAEN